MVTHCVTRRVVVIPYNHFVIITRRYPFFCVGVANGGTQGLVRKAQVRPYQLASELSLDVAIQQSWHQLPYNDETDKALIWQGEIERSYIVIGSKIK